VVAAADIVLSKPGYGTVTDCIAGRSRLVYTDRGDFPEYPVMVAEMPRYLPCLHVAQDAVLSARLEDPLRAVQEIPWPTPAPLDGALHAARRLLSLL
jgi:hypothetical protein